MEIVPSGEIEDLPKSDLEYYCCFLHIKKPFFLPNITSTPSVRPDSSSYRDTPTKNVVTGQRQKKKSRMKQGTWTNKVLTYRVREHINEEIRNTKNTKQIKTKGIPRWGRMYGFWKSTPSEKWNNTIFFVYRSQRVETTPSGQANTPHHLREDIGVSEMSWRQCRSNFAVVSPKKIVALTNHDHRNQPKSWQETYSTGDWA